MRKVKARIVSNKHIAGRYYKISIASPYLGKNTKPGQFFEVKCSEVPGEVLLRRPFGAYKISKSGVEILYEAVGKGTWALSKRKTGESLDVIGPLGNGFSVNRQTGKPANRQTILVAGGIGVAPLVALAETIVNRLASLPVSRLTVLIGAKTKNQILCEKEFKKFGYEVLVSTEDGSKGHKGLATELLTSLLNRQMVRQSHHPSMNHPELCRGTGKPANRQTTVYACGPTTMLKIVAQLASTHNIPCQVSLEERMACGVGVCLGCPVKVRTQYAIRTTQYEYKMVCKDGPVFDAKDIIW